MVLKYLNSATSLTLSSENCVGCGRCMEVCPHGVFKSHNSKALVVHMELCMECGACALNCPVDAIRVNAGVGCATAIIKGWFTGGEPTCDCSGTDCC